MIFLVVFPLPSHNRFTQSGKFGYVLMGGMNMVAYTYNFRIFILNITYPRPFIKQNERHTSDNNQDNNIS